jgi:hypothetical protein
VIRSGTQPKYRFKNWSIACECHADFQPEWLRQLFDLPALLEDSFLATAEPVRPISRLANDPGNELHGILSTTKWQPTKLKPNIRCEKSGPIPQQFSSTMEAIGLRWPRDRLGERAGYGEKLAV